MEKIRIRNTCSRFAVGVGEQVSNKVYVRLGELLDLRDRSSVLNVILTKILGSLKMWNSAPIVTKALKVGSAPD